MSIAEEFQKALDYINSTEDNRTTRNRYFCYSKEQKNIIKQYIPDADVIILPSYFNVDGRSEDTIYIIPKEDFRPIKFVPNEQEYGFVYTQINNEI